MGDAGRPEMWTGIECTVNRVGDRYFDQVVRSGHQDRPGDLDLFIRLGVAAMRYPVLWERVEDEAGHDDWRWSDERLAILRAAGVRPIVGLLHHGSGPRHTALDDPRFPELFAGYARRCAERYPWVEEWTPVNEPLTTARFSGLYGFWYPHGTDDRTFVAALINQCRGVALAMDAIRAVNPAARLVQTEDLGKAWSTPELAYQADFDNQRRWLSFDLLCGRVDAAHPLWAWLKAAGADQARLAELRARPCPPDVFGINHYLTSERWLDHRLALFPPGTHGGNGRDAYADVEAVRVGANAGPRALLREVWERYRAPLAVTEAHLHCTREEQLRWLVEVWEAAVSLRAEGIDLRAVTAWAGLGAFDWNSLLTCNVGHYEPGLYDLRAPTPRPTVIAGLVSALARGDEVAHPTLQVPGWWRRETRVLYPLVAAEPRHEPVPPGTRPLLITGANGRLGGAFARRCALRGIPHVSTSRDDLDIADRQAVRAVLDRHRPWAVINAAGYVRVTQAEADQHRCQRDNCVGAENLALACARLGIPSVDFSSHLVFGGGRGSPYREDDRPDPLNVYGRTKALAEGQVLAANPAALVVRTAAFFSPWHEQDFVGRVLRALLAGSPHGACAEVTVSPTYLPDLVDAVLDLLLDGETGLWHVVNDGAATWMDFALAAAHVAGVDAGRLEPTPAPAFIPRYSALTSTRGVLMRPWSDALRDWWCEAGPTLLPSDPIEPAQEDSLVAACAGDEAAR